MLSKKEEFCERLDMRDLISRPSLSPQATSYHIISHTRFICLLSKVYVASTAESSRGVRPITQHHTQHTTAGALARAPHYCPAYIRRSIGPVCSCVQASRHDALPAPSRCGSRGVREARSRCCVCTPGVFHGKRESHARSDPRVLPAGRDWRLLHPNARAGGNWGVQSVRGPEFGLRRAVQAGMVLLDPVAIAAAVLYGPAKLFAFLFRDCCCSSSPEQGDVGTGHCKGTDMQPTGLLVAVERLC